MGGIHDLAELFREYAPEVDLRGVRMSYERNPETGKDEQVFEFHVAEETGEVRVIKERMEPQDRAEDHARRVAEIARGVADRVVCTREPLPTGHVHNAPLAERAGLSVPQTLFNADEVTFKAAPEPGVIDHVVYEDTAPEVPQPTPFSSPELDTKTDKETSK